MEKEQRDLLAQQQETRCKMAALINAASTGKLKATEITTYAPKTAPPEASNQSETKKKVRVELPFPKIIKKNWLIYYTPSEIMTKTSGLFLAGDAKGVITEAINKF